MAERSPLSRAGAAFAPREGSRITAWRDALAVYRDRRVLLLVLVGFASGLPFGALAEPLTAWLAETGLTKTQIGLFAWVSFPYTWKFVLAPFIDRLPLPPFTTLLGRRRGWAIAAQLLLIGMLVGLGSSDPATSLAWTAALALATAIASAAQDIVLDAYRVEILDERTFAAGAATMVFGWRVGQMAAGAGGLILGDLLPWSAVYALMGGCVLVGSIGVLMGPRGRGDEAANVRALDPAAQAWLARNRRLPKPVADALAWLYSACVCPFREFLERRGALLILAFILLYKFGDAVLGIMKVPFFLEIGFSKTEIAQVVKIFGLFTIIGGGLIGGLIVARLGIMRGLLICGVAMALSNLIFVLQAWAGADLAVLALTVSVENITTGMGTTAFVAYMSSLCNVAYTATQYALLTSLMAAGRIGLSSGAGWLADQMSWPAFFVVTTFAAAPGLLLLLLLMRRFPATAPELSDALPEAGVRPGA